MSIPIIRLAVQEDRRIRAGHLWIYSNEIDTKRSPVKGLTPGGVCRFEDSRGRCLGTGYLNPHALLAGRLLSDRAEPAFDSRWFAERIAFSAALREQLFPKPYYRLVHGEGDGLPGLVVDRYGDVLVVQITTAGMEALKDAVIEALQSVLAPRGIVLRNDGSAREAEGLPRYVEAIGDVPEAVCIDESGTRFEIPMRGGQKTGWFYDQRGNRDRLQRYVRSGGRVLDVFSYAGGWAVRALRHGAGSAVCIDSSAVALEAARRNAALNDLSVETVQDDALDAMRSLAERGERFDLVVVDPPALIKRKRDHEAGLGLYGRLNRAALALLAPGGMLVSCSCSHHLASEELLRVLLRESRALGQRLQVLETLEQGCDHPVHPAIAETRYLKGYVVTVMPQAERPAAPPPPEIATATEATDAPC